MGSMVARMHGIREDAPKGQRAPHTVTTIFAICSFDSMYRCASTMSLNGKVRAMTGCNFPADN
jgi:hypothetical protein